MSTPPSRSTVAVVAMGAPWESPVLASLAAASHQLVLVKRCVDLEDLLATAATGTLDLALVPSRLRGLDSDSIEQLRIQGTEPVVLLDTGAGHTDEERLRGIGVRHFLEAARCDDIVAVLLASRESEPAAPIEDSGPPPVPATAESPTLPGRLVAVWGPAGAPGRTTVAVTLAALLGRSHGCAFLLDADPYGGSVAQHLGVLEEVSGLLAAARLANAGQLDAPRLAGAARSVEHGLRVLTGLPRPDRWREVRRGAFEGLLDLAVSLDPYVVVDTGFSLDSAEPDGRPSGAGRDAMTLAALESADCVVAVGAADPVGLTRLARGLLDLVEVVPRGPEVVLVNRMRSSLGWSERDIVATVGQIAPRADVVFLPDDRAAADAALVQGVTLPEAGDSALLRAMARCAELVAVPGPAGAKEPRRWRLKRTATGTTP